MRIAGTKNREWLNLSLVVIITILMALFSLSINFIDSIYKYLSVYSSFSLSESFVRVLFLWLVVTLWITHKSWSKAISKQRELEDIVSGINVDVLVVIDRDRNIIMCNASVKRVFGYDVNEVINRKIDLLYSKSDDNSPERDEITDPLKRDNYFVGLATGKNKNGDTFPLEITMGNRSNNNGVVLLLRDITERKKAEEALQEERDFSNMVIETADVLITGVDLEGKIFLFNRKAEEVTGYSREEVMGKDYVKVLIHEEGRTAFAKLMQEIIRRGKIIHTFDASLSTNKGEERTILSRGTSLKNVVGEIVGILGIGLDVTESRKMEEQLLQSEKLKSLGELSGGVAHDFNNLLAAILGRVQLLRINLKTPSGKQERRKAVYNLIKGLEIIEKAALDGAETVRRIQEFSRMKADDKDFTQVDINELLDNALEFTRIRWKNETESKGIKIRIKKELSPLAPILGSPSELREVFTNLINNAIDVMPQGGEIRVKSFMDDSIAVIRIVDTGNGIPKNIKDRIFDPFFTTKGVQSSGLGLSVSYGIINRHHGTITVDSVEGEETTFTIKFPITKKTDKGKVKEEKVIPIKRKQKKASILVIEDEEDVRELIRDILTDAGHDVETANDGSEGIEMFEKKKFDLVFTDLGMPVMSGWEVA